MSLLKEYKSSLKSIEIEEVLDLVFYRPLAFLFVKLIYRTSLTPNQITLLAMIVGLIGGVFFILNTHTAFIIAGFLLIAYDVLDCADGMLARLKKNGSPVGRILDGMADYVVTIFAYITIGIGLSSQSENALSTWVLVVTAGISNAFHAISLDYYRNRFMDMTQDRPAVLTDGLEEFRDEYEKIKIKRGYYFQKFLLKAYLRYSSVQGSVTSENNKSGLSEQEKQDYYNNNKKIIHFWTYLGPTTQLSFMIVCAFLNRLDIYLWGLILIGNSYALILFFTQKFIDKKPLPEGI
ncbi:MAG: CDP-alcohol phosphatidyltransferase family protein [Calditrichae bacterium]|nr:CDP-alcohol phosphatidyltransferase family protein [Calditrichia bacterium]